VKGALAFWEWGEYTPTHPIKNMKNDEKSCKNIWTIQIFFVTLQYQNKTNVKQTKNKQL
jgi:hypothetical protein